jgi:hypothetical protein
MAMTAATALFTAQAVVEITAEEVVVQADMAQAAVKVVVHLLRRRTSTASPQTAWY